MPISNVVYDRLIANRPIKVSVGDRFWSTVRNGVLDITIMDMSLTITFLHEAGHILEAPIDDLITKPNYGLSDPNANPNALLPPSSEGWRETTVIAYQYNIAEYFGSSLTKLPLAQWTSLYLR